MSSSAMDKPSASLVQLLSEMSRPPGILCSLFLCVFYDKSKGRHFPIVILLANFFGEPLGVLFCSFCS